MSRDNLPIDGEINPNHPVTQMARDQWHKIAAILLQRLGVDQVEITEADVKKLNDRNVSIVIHDRKEGLFIRLISEKDALELARKQGGMPA